MKNLYLIEIYLGKLNEYRWRIKCKGRIIADSGEGYKRKSTLRRSLNRLLAGIKFDQYYTKEL